MDRCCTPSAVCMCVCGCMRVCVCVWFFLSTFFLIPQFSVYVDVVRQFIYLALFFFFSFIYFLSISVCSFVLTLYLSFACSLVHTLSINFIINFFLACVRLKITHEFFFFFLFNRWVRAQRRIISHLQQKTCDWNFVRQASDEFALVYCLFRNGGHN